MRNRTFILLLSISVACGKDPGQSKPPDDPRTPCTTHEECNDNNDCTDDTCKQKFCENEPQENGYLCDDGDKCTDPDFCREGACEGTVVDCSPLSDLCNVGTCDPASGDCILTAADNGTLCNDGLACTSNDHCTEGECGGSPTDCSAWGGDCTLAECIEERGGCVGTPINENGNCEDDEFCTVNDTCKNGVCLGAPRDCDEPDPCTIDLCDDVANECQHRPVGLIPGAEGPPGDATCSDDIDNDCDGTVDNDGFGGASADVSCIPCTVSGDCDDGDPCTTDTCPVDACQNLPLDCADIDPCTSDFCDPNQGGCTNESMVIDASSPVGTSSDDNLLNHSCLTAGSGARMIVWTDLRDTNGIPVVGAPVTIGGETATASSGQPGIYYREVIAEASPTSTELEVSVTTCGQSVTMETKIALDNVAPNSTTGGTGGCSPTAGNLRVRVLTAESGDPIEGAHVLVGNEAEDAFEHNPEALFGGSSTSAANTTLTDDQGFATFYDYQQALDGPITVTAGADNRAYFTILSGDAADLVMALPLLHPPKPQQTTYDQGTSSVAFTDCIEFDVGLVLPQLDMETLTAFNFQKLLGRERCWDPQNTFLETIPLPENIWVPAQMIGPAIGPVCVPGSIAPTSWSVSLPHTADTGTTQNIQLAMTNAEINDMIDVLSSGGSVLELLQVLSYHQIGFILDEDVPTSPTSGRSFDNFDEYGHTHTVTYGGTPDEADVVGLTIADYAGTDGTGPLFLLSSVLHPFTEPGSSVRMMTSDLDQPGMPAGTRGLAMVVALYLSSDEHPDISANRRDAVTTILIRDNGAGAPVFDGTTDTTSTISNFLDLPGTDWDYNEPQRFVWDNAIANGNSPLFSIHELTLKTINMMPYLPDCQYQIETREELNTQWIVVKPFRPDCAGRECFDLPILPSSFPRAESANRKRSGFEQRVGRGYERYCTTDPSVCDIDGESCVDPDNDGSAFLCLGGSGTDADPHFYQQYWWKVHLYDLELAPSFDFNNFSFADRRKYMTHESSNGERFW